MMIVADAVSSIISEAGLPDGAIHVAQEVNLHRKVDVGELLVATAKVLTRGERQGWVLMTIELKVLDDISSGLVMDGRSTITFPVAGGS
jgi:hypothetical protein